MRKPRQNIKSWLVSKTFLFWKDIIEDEDDNKGSGIS